MSSDLYSLLDVYEQAVLELASARVRQEKGYREEVDRDRARDAVVTAADTAAEELANDRAADAYAAGFRDGREAEAALREVVEC